jgi:hypothetical protein
VGGDGGRARKAARSTCWRPLFSWARDSLAVPSEGVRNSWGLNAKKSHLHWSHGWDLGQVELTRPQALGNGNPLRQACRSRAVAGVCAIRLNTLELAT